MIDAWTTDPVKLIGAVIAFAALLVAFIGLLFTWRKFREDSLRRGDVLSWANEAIACLKDLETICLLSGDERFNKHCHEKLIKIAFDSTVLVERGRIFFKNQQSDGYGKEKLEAYRGFRPLVLDPLVAGHCIALRLLALGTSERIALKCVAEDNRRQFVSLIQKEIGRDRTASADTNKGGNGFNLVAEVGRISAKRIEETRWIENKDFPQKP